MNDPAIDRGHDHSGRRAACEGKGGAGVGRKQVAEERLEAGQPDPILRREWPLAESAAEHEVAKAERANRRADDKENIRPVAKRPVDEVVLIAGEEFVQPSAEILLHRLHAPAAAHQLAEAETELPRPI